MTGEPVRGGAAPPRLLRVEKGSPSDEELAALTAVLLARAGAVPDSGQGGGRAPAGPEARWRRPEREAAFANPRAWRRDGG
ncbi:acyl-CoA carboxylase epsilon subunit [Streptomyces anulatus]|uniref:acyl-CoA carboxylase epsilon subunit n=1 Tax=Streptomyces anulatus TaxID=1892 RepID=UPI002E359790|nr:acyl-CoA carboxylase epsilon subunit [Streptomyces anulatus]WTD26453.1 acyl-CoA carboxylase subunit epsilon [Streptomyces anulatus]